MMTNQRLVSSLIVGGLCFILLLSISRLTDCSTALPKTITPRTTASPKGMIRFLLGSSAEVFIHNHSVLNDSDIFYKFGSIRKYHFPQTVTADFAQPLTDLGNWRQHHKSIDDKTLEMLMTKYASASYDDRGSKQNNGTICLEPNAAANRCFYVRPFLYNVPPEIRALASSGRNRRQLSVSSHRNFSQYANINVPIEVIAPESIVNVLTQLINISSKRSLIDIREPFLRMQIDSAKSELTVDPKDSHANLSVLQPYVTVNTIQQLQLEMTANSSVGYVKTNRPDQSATILMESGRSEISLISGHAFVDAQTPISSSINIRTQNTPGTPETVLIRSMLSPGLQTRELTIDANNEKANIFAKLLRAYVLIRYNQISIEIKSDQNQLIIYTGVYVIKSGTVLSPFSVLITKDIVQVDSDNATVRINPTLSNITATILKSLIHIMPDDSPLQLKPAESASMTEFLNATVHIDSLRSTVDVFPDKAKIVAQVSDSHAIVSAQTADIGIKSDSSLVEILQGKPAIYIETGNTTFEIQRGDQSGANAARNQLPIKQTLPPISLQRKENPFWPTFQPAWLPAASFAAGASVPPFGSTPSSGTTLGPGGATGLTGGGGTSATASPSSGATNSTGGNSGSSSPTGPTPPGGSTSGTAASGGSTSPGGGTASPGGISPPGALPLGISPPGILPPSPPTANPTEPPVTTTPSPPPLSSSTSTALPLTSTSEVSTSTLSSFTTTLSTTSSTSTVSLSSSLSTTASTPQASSTETTSSTSSTSTQTASSALTSEPSTTASSLPSPEPFTSTTQTVTDTSSTIVESTTTATTETTTTLTTTTPTTLSDLVDISATLNSVQVPSMPTTIVQHDFSPFAQFTESPTSGGPGVDTSTTESQSTSSASPHAENLAESSSAAAETSSSSNSESTTSAGESTTSAGGGESETTSAAGGAVGGDITPNPSASEASTLETSTASASEVSPSTGVAASESPGSVETPNTAAAESETPSSNAPGGEATTTAGDATGRQAAKRSPGEEYLLSVKVKKPTTEIDSSGSERFKNQVRDGLRRGYVEARRRQLGIMAQNVDKQHATTTVRHRRRREIRIETARSNDTFLIAQFYRTCNSSAGDTRTGNRTRKDVGDGVTPWPSSVGSYANGDVGIEVTSVDDLPTEAKVRFFVVSAGRPIMAPQAKETFSQLSDAELSAILSFPILQPVETLLEEQKAPKVQPAFIVPVVVILSALLLIAIAVSVYYHHHRNRLSKIKEATSDASSDSGSCTRIISPTTWRTTTPPVRVQSPLKSDSKAAVHAEPGIKTDRSDQVTFPRLDSKTRLLKEISASELSNQAEAYNDLFNYVKAPPTPKKLPPPRPPQPQTTTVSRLLPQPESFNGAVAKSTKDSGNSSATTAHIASYPFPYHPDQIVRISPTLRRKQARELLDAAFPSPSIEVRRILDNYSLPNKSSRKSLFR